MIIDGRAIADEVLEGVRSSHKGTVCLRAIAVAPDAATKSYLRAKHRAAVKAGIELQVVELPEDAPGAAILAAIAAPGADGIIVQLPLPGTVDAENILNAIPVAQDADVLSVAASAAGMLVPPVAAAVEQILARGSIPVAGARAVVIGEGRLVGAPVAERLRVLGAQVATYNEHTFTPDALASVDIVVSGAGVPHLVKPEMLAGGVALIDAGTSESGGALVGDIDPACAHFARLYTPVPGGVGPIAVACLMRNAVQLQKARIAVH